MDKARKNNKSFFNLMFGEPNKKQLTELEKIREEEKYYDKLIQIIHDRIDMLSNDIKMKIAEDAIKKMSSYFSLFDLEREEDKK